MWIRRELKDRAKAVLRGNYWKAFLISLVILIATGSGGGGGGGGGNDSGMGGSEGFPWDFGGFDILVVLMIISAAFILIMICLAIRIFLGYPLEVGGRRYFIQSALYADNRWCFRFAFDGRHYIGIVASMLLKGVQNFLWFLLFIIPGIVKAYAYSMVPYILAENPRIGAKRAIMISNEMTKGYKFDMFVLDLSFLGWYILGLIAFVVGTLFVNPYYNATRAELYLVMRQSALERGICRIEELAWNRPEFEAGSQY